MFENLHKSTYRNESLESDKTQKEHDDWVAGNCQPNFWRNVVPDPKQSCGPFEPVSAGNDVIDRSELVNEDNHDTIGMVAFDGNGKVKKIPGKL